MFIRNRYFLKIFNQVLYCLSIALLIGGMILSMTASPVEAASGSVKTKNSCGASAQNANDYAVGDTIYVAYADLGTGSHIWTINYTNKPGKPLVTVAGSSPLIQGTGTVTGDSGCFPAWVVQPEEAGYHFSVEVGGKSDGYNVNTSNSTPTATATFAPTATATFAPTATATHTATATFTPTVTATHTATATFTPTATFTATATTPAPTETTPAPTETTPAPTETAPIPTETTPAPTETTPAPTKTTPAPTETTPAPTETTPAPTETTPAPTETTPAPTETTPAPTETAPAPSETTPAPTETAPALTDPSPTETGTPSVLPTDPTLNPTPVPTLSMPAAVDNMMINPITGADTLVPASSRSNPRSLFMSGFSVFGMALMISGYRRKKGL